jgi:hypothetical protein
MKGPVTGDGATAAIAPFVTMAKRRTEWNTAMSVLTSKYESNLDLEEG